MKLTRGEEVAILLVSVIGRASGRISLSDISREHGVSLLFLKKIARSLRQAGIIDSKEGAGGGYVLAKDPSAISVLDILEAVGGQKEAILPETSRICPLAPDCLPQKIRQFISNAFSRYCSNVSIDQIVKNNTHAV
jgi:Rrf2 family iron-sulfur cluster assembly transcriptional regulator